MAAPSLRCVRIAIAIARLAISACNRSTIRPSSWIAAAGGVLGSLEVRDDLARFRRLVLSESAVADGGTYFLVACMKACISSRVSLPSLLLSIALKIRSWAA